MREAGPVKFYGQADLPVDGRSWLSLVLCYDRRDNDDSDRLDD